MAGSVPWRSGALALDTRARSTWPTTLGVRACVVPRTRAPRCIGVRPRHVSRPHSSHGRTALVCQSVRVLSLGTYACRGRHRTGGIKAWGTVVAEAWPFPDAYLSGRRPPLAHEPTAHAPSVRHGLPWRPPGRAAVPAHSPAAQPSNALARSPRSSEDPVQPRRPPSLAGRWAVAASAAGDRPTPPTRPHRPQLLARIEPW
jgi:hypothetical protein